MIDRPAYYNRINMRAIEDWDLLTAKPHLAGAWRQLFRQVQSPRHVLSELLQNADDAGATDASVEILDDVFMFSHNGVDFDEKSFSSLCSFGYSNKTTLHTIGFRGVGFKSTFSLGDRVEVLTPTLSICFERDRFTEPKWINLPDKNSNLTQIRVRIKDHGLENEIIKNISEWTSSPASLLFFRKIKRLRLQDNTVEWRHFNVGPIPNSSWLSFDHDDTNPVLVIKSELEAFPDSAIEEIKNERGDQIEQDFDIPKCSVEIVLGIPGHLFVVLQTEVRTSLPFACNAPFIQDPARMQIKDPASSPTNRWLLERIGRLAASAMHEWIDNRQLPIQSRAEAYRLIPPANEEPYSLENSVREIITQSFRNALNEERLLLTDDGEVVGRNRAISLPRSLCEVWTPKLVSEMLDTESRPALSQRISQNCVSRLSEWQLIDRLSSEGVFKVLRKDHPPRPDSWQKLTALWSYLVKHLPTWYTSLGINDLNLVPVQGKTELYAAERVVRLGEKRLLNSTEDWEFLSRYLLVLDTNWSRYLTDTQREAEEQGQSKLLDSVRASSELLRRLGLDKSSDASKVIGIAANKYFAEEDADASGCVRFAHIAAKLGISIDQDFRFLTTMDNFCSTDDVILLDEDGSLSELLEPMSESLHFLNSMYFEHFSTCTREEWTEWAESGKSKLHVLPPLEEMTSKFWKHYKLEEFVQRTYGPAVTESLAYPYVTRNETYQSYLFRDFDWPSSLVDGLNAIPGNQNAWGIVVSKLLKIGSRFWSGKDVAQAEQNSTGGGIHRRIYSSKMSAAWLRRLRDTACLPDTHGIFRKPSELLLRTKETESLLDLELFVDRDIDTEANRSTLLLLGVRDVPPGPNRILECLRALSGVANAPLHELQGLYRKLDQYCATGPTEDIRQIQAIFHSESLILTRDCEWVTSQGVFVLSGNDPIGLPTIHQSVADLSLWRRIGVQESPDADDILKWICTLSGGKRLSQTELSYLNKQLSTYPAAIWDGCSRWPNLAGELCSTDSLKYSLSMHRLVPWSHLFDNIKQSTADLRMLSLSNIELPPFCDLPLLSDILEEKLDGPIDSLPNRKQVDWMLTVGRHLKRFVHEDGAIQERVRSMALRLTNTLIARVTRISVAPYIGGVPAGTTRSTDVLWANRVLYLEDSLSVGRLAKRVPETLGQAFGLPEITSALSYCYQRDPEEIAEYFADNFVLEPLSEGLANNPEPQVHSHEDTPTGKEFDSARDDSELLENEQDDHAESYAMNNMPSARIEMAGRAQTYRPNSPADDHGEHNHDSNRSSSHGGPSLIERFAGSQGFRLDGDHRFVGNNGEWIARATGELFPWERRDTNGNLERCYLPISHCLETQPLQIGTEIWSLLESRPELYALILIGRNGAPTEVSGSSLCQLKAQGRLVLYPAAYRLVYSNDHHRFGEISD